MSCYHLLRCLTSRTSKPPACSGIRRRRPRFLTVEQGRCVQQRP